MSKKPDTICPILSCAKPGVSDFRWLEGANRWHRACPHCGTEWDEPKWLEATEALEARRVDTSGLDALVDQGKLEKHGGAYSMTCTVIEIEERLRRSLKDEPAGHPSPAAAPEADTKAVALQLADAHAENDTWRALCAFLLTAEEPIAFLRCWNEGNFEACRREWPEAPPDVYPGKLSVREAA